MGKASAGAAFALPLLVTGSIYLIVDSLSSTSSDAVHYGGVVLTSGDSNDALVLIPAENAEYANVANALYLAPNGFDGTATVFLTPSAGNEVENVVPGVQALVQTIEADYTADDLSAADPLYVFGYSEGAVEEGLAEQQLHDFGVPADDLNFVMVGDSASAEGGFLNTFIDSLPESWQQPTTELFAQLGLSAPVLGAITPVELVPHRGLLPDCGWLDRLGRWRQHLRYVHRHLEYLGLTPAEIATATETETTDGMTDYFTIDNSNVNDLAALSNQFLLALGIVPGNVSTDAADTAATSAATPDAFAELLSQSAADFATLSADFHTLATDLSVDLFTALGVPDLFLP